MILQSGSAAGREVRRKPRLQVRLPNPDLNNVLIRKALNLALQLDHGTQKLSIQSENTVPVTAQHAGELMDLEKRQKELEEENIKLRATLTALAFDVSRHGDMSREEALYVLGFSPKARPDKHTIRARFKMLAMLYHPDSLLGDHKRMVHLNQALSCLGAK